MNTSSGNRAGAPFRLGVVGAGRMGMVHLQALKGCEGIVVAGVADPAAEARLAVAREGYRAFGSLEELLEYGQLDGVLVAAPTGVHLALVRDLVRESVPVLCEKPCGLTVAEAEECGRLALEAGSVLQVAYWRRFVPELQALRERVLSGQVGDVLAVDCQQWDAAPPPLEFREGSGGILVDMGVHEFDQVRWLTGQEFVSVKGVVSTVGESGADPDCAQLVAALGGGSTAAISLGRWHPAGDSCKVDLYGTKATESSWFLRPDAGADAFLRALRAQAQDFVGRVASGSGAGACVADAVAALRVARDAEAAVEQVS